MTAEDVYNFNRESPYVFFILAMGSANLVLTASSTIPWVLLHMVFQHPPPPEFQPLGTYWDPHWSLLLWHHHHPKGPQMAAQEHQDGYRYRNLGTQLLGMRMKRQSRSRFLNKHLQAPFFLIQLPWISP